MKNTLISLILLLSTLAAQGSVSVITDLDDTVKITNAGNPLQMTINGLFTKTVFAGMGDFLYEAKGNDKKTFFVSSSPGFLRGRINGLFVKYQIESDALYLRNPLKEKTPEFKKRVIRDILANTTDTFIVIGDDVNEDHNIYDELIQENPTRILAAYIHVVKGRELPATVTPFYTSFDLAMREFAAGRLEYSSVDRVASVVLGQEKFKRIMPKFAVCPTDAHIWDWQLSTEAANLSAQVSELIVTSCSQRISK